MTILVTGATGTVGRHVVNHLVRAGQPVRVLTRDPGRARTGQPLPDAVEIVAGDLTAPESLDAALTGVTAMHLIAIGGDGYTPLKTAEAVLAHARTSAGVRRVTVLTGTEDELAVADAVAASGLEWTHVRPVEFMANKLQWAESIRTEGVVRAPFGSQPHALVDEADVAAVIASALLEPGHSGKTYVPTGPDNITPVEATKHIAEQTGRQIEFIELTSQQMRQQMRDAGFGDDVIDAVIGYGEHPPGSAHTVLPTVEDITGRPARTFPEWVAAHADAFRH
ncbi:MAG: NAD(P)H-binding protein [Micromonosporaceae bacterium]